MNINIVDRTGESVKLATWDQVGITRFGQNLNDVQKITLSIQAGDIVQVDIERYNFNHLEGEAQTYNENYIVTSDSLKDIELNVVNVGNVAALDSLRSKVVKGTKLERLEE